MLTGILKDARLVAFKGGKEFQMSPTKLVKRKKKRKTLVEKGREIQQHKERTLRKRMSTVDDWTATIMYCLYKAPMEEVFEMGQRFFKDKFVPESFDPFEHSCIRKAIAYEYQRRVHIRRAKESKEELNLSDSFKLNYALTLEIIGLKKVKGGFEMVAKRKNLKTSSGKPDGRFGERKGTIRALVQRIFIKKPNISTEKLIEMVQKRFPDSAFNANQVGYYKTIFRREGMPIPYAHDVAKKHRTKISKVKKAKKKVVQKAPPKKKKVIKKRK